jgi:hypothetical protein
MALFGPSGAGKTTLLKTLPPEETRLPRSRGGLKSVQDWRGDSLPIRRFADAVDIACLIGGANPAAQPDEHFSEAHHAHLRAQHPAGRAARRQAHRLRRQHHRPDAPGDGLGQDPARGAVGTHRQTGHARRLRAARPRGDRAPQAPPACARPHCDLRRHPRADRRRDEPGDLAAADGGRKGRARAARHRRPGDDPRPLQPRDRPRRRDRLAARPREGRRRAASSAAPAIPGACPRRTARGAST